MQTFSLLRYLNYTEINVCVVYPRGAIQKEISAQNAISVSVFQDGIRLGYTAAHTCQVLVSSPPS